MSENGVTRLLLIILAFTWPQRGTSLECYVCTSVNDAACTSSLSGIELSTCTWDESSNSSTTTVAESETTTVSTESATSSDAVTTITPITDASTSSASSTSAETTTIMVENLTSDSTTLETTTSSRITTTNIIERTTVSSSGTTEAQTTTQGAITTQSVTSAAATTTEGTTTAGTESTSATVVSTLSGSLDSKSSEPLVRSVRATDVNFACYTLTLIKDGETVTDRGCVVQSDSMCETLNEENYPGQNLSTCTTCTEDGCNSSPINTSGISSLLFPFIMFILTR